MTPSERLAAAEAAIAKQMRCWRLKRLVNVPEMIGRLSTWFHRPRCKTCNAWFDPFKLQPYSETNLCLDCVGRALKEMAHRKVDLYFSLIGRES